MRIDWDTPIDMLMHSDDIAYIDLDEGELCHWKYIKREKLSNGKYRYYYSQSELDAAKREIDIANKKSVGAAIDVYNAKKQLSNPYGLDAKEEARFQKDLKTADYAIRAHQSYVEEAQAAEKRYQTMKITSFPARAISKGVVKIANLLSGLSKKKKKR